MGANRLQGIPWHEERFHRTEGDERRYKGRCKYYSDEDGKCSYRYDRCLGSGQCDYYEAMTDQEFKLKQARLRRSKKKNGEDDCAWY